MRAALRVLALSASLAALLVIGGGHWAVLQTAAWARMIVAYTQDCGSLRQGVAETFDGVHPCELCRQISAGIQKEKHDDRQRTGQDERLGKISFTAVLTVSFSTPFLPLGVQMAATATPTSGRLADAPPVPPPRAA